MRLQKHLSRKYGNTTYYKYVIVVPSNLIEKLEWKDEQEIKGTIKNKKLVIEKV
jgi:antitoxin component of MazEF toxin-antitoxin module